MVFTVDICNLGSVAISWRYSNYKAEPLLTLPSLSDKIQNNVVPKFVYAYLGNSYVPLIILQFWKVPGAMDLTRWITL